MVPQKHNHRAPCGSLAFYIKGELDVPRLIWDERSAMRATGLEAVVHPRPALRAPASAAVVRIGQQPAATPLLGCRPMAFPTSEQQQLLTLIDKQGGRITARALMRTSRRYHTAEQAQQALSKLVDAGFISKRLQQPSEHGGRAFEVFEAPLEASFSVRAGPASAALRSTSKRDGLRHRAGTNIPSFSAYA
jgi:hypothetical protein